MRQESEPAATTASPEVVSHHHATAARLSSREIRDAYLYLLGRLLVLRQEHLDLLGGARWNQLVHRELGSTEHGGLDLACSDAWVAVDEASYTLVEVPRIVGRYHTLQVVNCWGETIANINERTFPERPHGLFALCLKGTHVKLPHSAQRIDLPCRKARLFVRVELGTDPEDALAVQRQFTMHESGTPLVPATVGIPLFSDDRLPGVEAFDRATEVLASALDTSPGMDVLQAKVRMLAALVRSEGDRARIDHALREQAWDLPRSLFVTHEQWTTQRLAGCFGDDWLARTAANLHAIWSNTRDEVATFQAGIAKPLDGDRVYAMTFGRDDLPSSHVHYLWSVSCCDAGTRRVVQDRRDRALLSGRSPLRLDRDGRLTLYFARELPRGVPEGNWLATPAGRGFLLTWRAYGPDAATIAGRWFPPAMHEVRSA